MKKFKKILAILICLTLFVTTLPSIIISASNDDVVIETIKADLYKSEISTNTNFNISNFKNGVIRLGVAVGTSSPFTGTDKKYQLSYITLCDADGEIIRIPEGYKYAVNVIYSISKVNSNPSIALVYNDNDNATQDNGAYVIAHQTKTATGRYALSAVVDGVGNRPLRLAFGGGGIFAVEAVEIECIPDDADVKTVNYVSEGLTTKGFATDTLKTPEILTAKETVFGGWFTDSALTNAATSITDGATYYARWRSITHELDIENSNRMNGYNPGGSSASNNSLAITPVDGGLRVNVNKTYSSSNMSNLGIGLSDLDQQITLEYADYDNNVQDGYYTNYVVLDKTKRYAINVKYNVVSVSGTLAVGLVGAANNLGWTGNQSNNAKNDKIFFLSNNITTTGSRVLTASYNAGDLLDTKYGGANLALHDAKKLRLAFEGVGTIIIESITIQEVNYEDENVVGVKYSDNGLTYTAGAVKTLDGDWVIPKPVKKDSDDVVFDNWYTNSTLTTPMTTPVKKTTYYPKWLLKPTVYDIDLIKTQILKDKIGNTSNKSMVVTPDAVNNDLLIDLYSGWNNIFINGNGNINSGALWPDALIALKFGNGTDPSDFVKLQKDYKYIVNVEYEVISASADYNPQIAIVKNNSTVSAGINGSVVLNTTTHSATGKYSISAVMSNIDNVPLRLAFGGVGQIKITSVKLNLEMANDNTIIPVTYIDGESNYAKFQKLDSVLDVPTKDDFQFIGWFDANGNKLENTNGVTTELTVYAKWSGIRTEEINPTKSQILKYKDGNGNTVLEIAPDENNNDLDVKVNSGWKNVLVDENGNYKTGVLWPDALLALKFGDGSDPSDFVKLQKNYKYVVNIEYEVISASDTDILQIAIVKNNSTVSAQDNGSIILNANTHSTPGEYSISAVMSNIDNVPLRMAFGGIADIKITSIKLTSEHKNNDTTIPVTYVDGESNYAKFQELNSALDVPVSQGFVFDGWFNSSGDKVVDINGVTEPVTVTAKWTGVKTVEIDLTKSEALRKEDSTGKTVMNLEVDGNDDLNIKLDSGWNNIFKDKNGELRTNELAPDAIIALKNGIGTTPKNYFKVGKYYKYLINVDYEVKAADPSFNPQIAIVRNKSTNSAQLNGTYVLNANTHSDAGEYQLSAIVSNLNNIPIRLAFGGLGEIVVKKVTVSLIMEYEDKYVSVTYYDGESNFSVYQNHNSALYTPAPNDFEFVGWYNKAGEKVENTNGVTDSMSVYAKWTGIQSFDVKPAISQALKFENTSKEVVMELTPNSDDTLDIVLKSGWNNIFRDKSGNLRTKTRGSDGKYKDTLLYPDAILALKTGIDDEPTSYLKLKKNYNYVINIDYSVTSVHSDFAPQIAIIKNATTNSAQLNGSIVLNSNTHINKGDYSISAYAENINGVPIRLAFGGIGKIVIKKITVSYIRAVDDSYNPVTYVDGDANNAVFLKKGENLSNPADTTGFKGWYKNSECIGKPINSVDGPATVYAKRNLPAYTFNINFDTQIQKDYYAQGNNTLTNFANMGSKAEVVTSVGNNGTDAVRLTYKRIDSDNTDYVANPYLNLYDTNITTGAVTDKRFVGKANTQYMVTFKYKVEETDGKSLELYLGKRNFGQSSNPAINDFGQGLWQIKDATKIGATITEKTNGWIEAKAYYTAASGWFPVILLKTNNQSKSVDPTTALASILIDDISLTEITPITEDTVLGTMDYENYTAKTYDSASADSIIGNKYGVKVTNSVNHTNNGKNALELTLMSDSLQYSGNTVISINNEPLRSERNAAYLVEFYVMSPNKIDDLIWGVNSVAGDYSSITSKHNIEIRDKINLKANKWEKITAYIPKFKGFEDAIAMFSIAMAANGYDGTNVYIDDISVKLLIESEVVNFVDSDKENPVLSIAQRGFKGQPFNSFPYFEKDGFLFDGWYDTADCDGKEYKVSDIFPEDKDEITLYAKWISTDDVVAKDFTAGSFDVDIYDKDVVPYENICETSEESIYGITNVNSTQSGAWVKDAGIYGNGTADYDGALSLSNDTYSRYLDTDGRNAIALINEDGTRFAVKKGEKYSIKFDYINGSNVGTSYIQTVISTGNGYRGFGDGKDQGLRNIAVHGTDSDYQTYQEYFVADYTGFVYITFAARTDDNSPHNSLYHRVYIDNVKITTDSDVKKLTFIADGKTYRTYYGKAGDIFPVFDAIEGDTRTTEFDGFYTDAKFENRIENYVFTNEDVQTVYIKYKKVDYTTPSNFSSPITLDFEDTKWLGDYYRQGKHMTYWSRGEANPEWQFIYSNKENAYGGSNYIKLNGYTTYWNIAKFTLYDKSNPSGTMLLEKGMTYRVKLMTRCEDKYDSPNLTVTLENPNTRYLLENNTAYAMVAEEKEYANDYMCYTVDITVPDDIRYLPALAIRKNQNDLQTLFIDEVSVEKLINCQVTFEENGGTEVDDITVQIHETIPDPGMPFREGYDFKGWFMDAELTKAWDFDTMTVESDVTLYAKWEKAANELETDVSLEEDTDSNPPTMLEGDNHNYPVAAGLSTWIIVLIVAGSVIALLGVAALVWLLIVRKKRKN